MIAFSRVLGHEVAATLMEDVEEIRTPSSTFMRTSSKPSRRRKTCSIRQKAIAVGEAHIDCRAIGVRSALKTSITLVLSTQGVQELRDAQQLRL